MKRKSEQLRLRRRRDSHLNLSRLVCGKCILTRRSLRILSFRRAFSLQIEAKTKSRRADSNRWPHLITSDNRGVAEACRGLQIAHTYALFSFRLATGCAVLRSRLWQCDVNVTHRGLGICPARRARGRRASSRRGGPLMILMSVTAAEKVIPKRFPIVTATTRK